MPHAISSVDMLFPRDDEPVFMKQAPGVGSCYYLAYMDCLFQTTEGRQLIKDKFFFHPDGRLGVRLKRNSHSPNLLLSAPLMHGKYELQQTAAEDIFIISDGKLKDLIDDKTHVDSNSLALQILEHVFGYYYYDPSPAAIAATSPATPSMTVRRHNLTTRKEASEIFLAEAFGVSGYDLDINMSILLKTVDPSAPIYIAMDYHVADSKGMMHAAHALRVDKIVPDGRGGHNFILVNPWNNTLRETYSAIDILHRRHRLSYSNINTKNIELIRDILSKCSLRDAQYICAYPKLFQEFLSMKATFVPITSFAIDFHIWQHMNRVVPEANRIIQQHIAQIEALDATFRNNTNEGAIGIQKANFVNQLQALQHNPAYVFAKETLGAGDPPAVSAAYHKKLQMIESHASQAIEILGQYKPVIAAWIKLINDFSIDFSRARIDDEVKAEEINHYSWLDKINAIYLYRVHPALGCDEAISEVKSVVDSVKTRISAAAEMQRKAIVDIAATGPEIQN